MRGGGSSRQVMSTKAPPRCLDLSRLVSRVGRGPLTGVDRVERAYLDHLLAAPGPLFSLVRMRLSYAVLDRAGTQALADRLAGDVPWGTPDLRARLTPKLSRQGQQVEADLRRLALGTCLRRNLYALLARHWPKGMRYLNVGHSNLTQRVLWAVSSQPDAEVSVLVHDMIPLDYPEYQRPGQPAKFERAMRMVSRYATRVICNSEATRQRVVHYFNQWGRMPEALVAHLGVETMRPDAAALPDGLPPQRPYFIALGTIEPRKNHALLLDVWTQMEADGLALPVLLIVGARGWNNEAVFTRLDSSPMIGRDIFELSGLGDQALAALVQNATAMLFPSRAEGFGLPPAEALALGTPAICADLPVYREFMGELPVYLNGNDRYLWAKTIHEMATKGLGETRIEPGAAALPTWDAHFNQILSVT